MFDPRDTYICVDGVRVKISDETADSLRKQFAPKTYRVGDRFQYNKKNSKLETYVLACVADGKVALINLNSGFRYTDGKEVEDISIITKTELKQCCIDIKDFTKLEK